MKKRIAAMLLAAVMVFHIGGEACRAKAVAAGAATAFAYVVYNLYAVMTGCWDDCAEALGCFIENGVDGWEKAFVGSEDTPSWFSTGWNQIFKTVSGWFDSGTVTLDENGKAYITYYQYLDLCSQLAEYMDYSISGIGMANSLISYPLNTVVSFGGMPTYSSLFEDVGQSYIPVSFTESDIYFSSRYYNISLKDYYMGDTYVVGRSLRIKDLNNGISCLNWGGSVYPDAPVATMAFDKVIGMFTGDKLYINTNTEIIDTTSNIAIDHLYHFDGSTLEKDIPLSTDLSWYKTGYFVCDGDASEMIDKLDSYVLTQDLTPIEDLSDPLEELLVINPNPGLVIDPNPAIPIPTDAVTVTDIPLVDDITLTDVMTDTMPIGLNMQLPKTIFDKFPFSLPFDLYRLLTIFVAEPVTPVFRIPISNVNVDMSAFEGNQTFGQYSYSETFEPMFEIDEEIVIDFSGLPFIQWISHSCFIVGFISFLILITTKLIHH